jgi:hypothetical protein
VWIMYVPCVYSANVRYLVLTVVVVVVVVVVCLFLFWLHRKLCGVGRQVLLQTAFQGTCPLALIRTYSPTHTFSPHTPV